MHDRLLQIGEILFYLFSEACIQVRILDQFWRISARETQTRMYFGG